MRIFFPVISGFGRDYLRSGMTTTGLVLLRRGFSVAVLTEELALFSYCTDTHEIASRSWYIPDTTIEGGFGGQHGFGEQHT